MYKELKKITIDGVEYPVKFDLNVLQAVQEEFESVTAFERELLGIKLIKDKKGKQKYTKDGYPEMEIIEPSIRAIKTALTAMINEGLALEAYRDKKEFKAVDAVELIASCDIAYPVLSTFIYSEYKECFKVKKI